VSGVADASTNLQKKSEFVTGSSPSIADLAILLWAYSAKWCAMEIEESPAVRTWIDKMLARPALQKGLSVSVPYPFGDDRVKDPANKDFIAFVKEKGGEGVRMATEI
jgi:hypothetical protein